ncbi:MAG TPA: serine/threonine-protein kinase [Gemmataceae bacterium]|nr:serine/threonine-protein kinase [Gemmataceae bacterium]
MMTPSSSNGATIGQLAAEWRERLRQGERPEMDDYLHRYPELAEEIRELFPAVVLMEDLKGDAGDLTGSVAVDTLAVEGRRLERLGDFRILREIGRGGMGVVYEAEQESLGRRVALKVLPPQALLDPRYHKRFQREAKAAAKLHHTNIVPVFGVGEHEGTCYYVMQFISGLGLDNVLIELKRQRQASGVASAPRVSALPQTQTYQGEAELSALDVARSLMLGAQDGAATVREQTPEPPLPHGRGSELLSESGSHYWRSVARIGMQVAEALDYAGSQGILHRDIKPSNLLLDTRGNVWVTDFGLAKAGAEENLTHTGDVIGTLRYMAPERFEGRSDLRGDIYSLGLTLYELLTLQPAFGEKDRSKLIHQVTTLEPTPPRRLDSRIPRDLETIVLKAIARDPAHRYQTGTELATDLQRFVEDRPILARRVSVRERLWRWCRRNPMVASLTTALFLVLVGGLIGVTTQWRRAEDNADQARRNEYEAKKERDAAEAARDEARTTSNKLRNVLYAADMNLAQAAWEANDIGRVLRLLESHRPHPDEEDLRGFEWHYWQRQCHPELRMVEIPELRRSASTGRWASNGAFNQDGTRLAAGVRSEDGETDEVRIWDAVSGKQQFIIPGLRFNAYYPLALSPNGELVAFRMRKGAGVPPSGYEVKVWDTRASKEILSIPRGDALAFSPDGKRLAVSIVGENSDKPEDGYRVAVWDLESRKELFGRRVTANLGSLVFSPDGSRLAVGLVLRDKNTFRAIEASLRIWDAANGNELKSMALPRDLTDVVPVFSPDGARLFASCWFLIAGSRTSLHAWDVASSKELFAVSSRFGKIDNLRFSLDGKFLAVWGTFEPTIDIVDSLSGKKRFALYGHTRDILAVVFSDDGRRLRSASADGTIRDWSVALPAEKPRSEQSYYPRAISRDGSRMALTLDLRGTKELKVVDRKGRGILSFSLPSGYPDGGVTFSSDGKRLTAVWYDEEAKTPSLKMWNVVTGAKLLDIPLGKVQSYSLAFSPDGRRLAASTYFSDSDNQRANYTHGVKIWDAENGKELFSQKWRADVPYTMIDFRPDGARHAALSMDGTLRIWETVGGREILTRKYVSTWPPRIRYSPDGRIVVCNYGEFGAAGSLRVRDAETGEELFALTGHSGGIGNFVFSPDGRRIASLSSGRGGKNGMKLWDAGSGQELLSFTSEGRRWRLVQFSSDGRQLMAMRDDSLEDLIQVWDATPRGE